jgi:C1A family cysteine protease
MKKKLFGILVCTLLIAIMLPVVDSMRITTDECMTDAPINEHESNNREYLCPCGVMYLDESEEANEIKYSKVLEHLPPCWDWRDIDGEDWTTPVKNQYQDICGSCWAFGSLAGLEVAIKIWENNPDLDVDLSEQYMLSCSPGSCDGWYWMNTLNWIKKHGAIPESCFPYEADDTIPCEAKCPEWRDLLVGIDDRARVSSNVSVIQSALIEYGPLPGTMTVYEDFYPDYSGGVYRHTYGDEVFGHCITIVGYDDTWGGEDEGCWICKNSWGTEWGEDGWFRIAYGECKIEKGVYYFTGPNYPPEKPGKPIGPTRGNPGTSYTYSATAIDSDGDTIRYYFDWGDGTITHSDYVASGETVSMEHTWMEKGTYDVRVQVKDEHGLEADWSDQLSVSMPKNKQINTPFLRFLEQHPHMSLLLRQILNFQ